PAPAVRVLHAAVPGRVRLGVAGLKRNPPLARHLEAEAGRWAGIQAATASPTTGTLLLQFAPAGTDVASLIARVEAVGGSPSASRRRARATSLRTAASRTVTQAVEALEATPVPPPASTPVRALEATLGAAAVLGSGALLLAVRAHGHDLAIDQAPLEWAAELHSPALTGLMRAVSRFVEPLVL